MSYRAQMFVFTVVIAACVILIFAMEVSSSYALNFILALITLLLLVFGFSTKYYMYIMIPALRIKGKTVVLNSSESFIFAPSGVAIIYREEDTVYATSFIKIPIYRSGTEMNDEERANFARMFSRILSLSKVPVKIGAQLYIVNKDEYIGKIRDKLNEVEERYRTVAVQENTNNEKLSDRIKGEVTMWRNLLDNVSASRSQALLAYAMVSAEGGNDEEASNIAYQRANELAAGISAVLGVSAYVAKGDEILTLIEPDYMIPIGAVSEALRQKSVEEGL